VSDTFFEVARRQRACRAFRDEPVPDELVERVLEAATFAPSAENRQPWVFVVVRNGEARARIGELTRKAWEGGGRDRSRGRLREALFADVDRGATGGIAAAPVLVVVAADLERCLETTMAASILPAVQNLLLGATALGLGSALTTLTTVFADELRDVVGLPGRVRPVAVVPLGWPARPLGAPRREPVAEHGHRERYGAGW
jgi:nitroreductase